jgi:hypothetical protein
MAQLADLSAEKMGPLSQGLNLPGLDLPGLTRLPSRPVSVPG